MDGRPGAPPRSGSAPRRSSPSIARIEALWTETRRRFGSGAGPLLIGTSRSPTPYAPIAFRFQTYGVEPVGEAGPTRAVLALPAVKAWEAGGKDEAVLADHDLDVLYPEDHA